MSRTGVMLPSVVGASAATSCLVQERFPRAYLMCALRQGVWVLAVYPASSGTASRVGTSVTSALGRGQTFSYAFGFVLEGLLGGEPMPL